MEGIRERGDGDRAGVRDPCSSPSHCSMGEHWRGFPECLDRLERNADKDLTFRSVCWIRSRNELPFMVLYRRLHQPYTSSSFSLPRTFWNECDDTHPTMDE